MRIPGGVVVTVFAVGALAAGGLAAAGCGSVSAMSRGPVGTWRVAYNGYGQVHMSGSSDDRTFALQPARPKAATSTHSALVLSSHSVHDFSLVVRMRTTSQLRRPHPNNWEVGWLLWHYTDNRHFYYVILKPKGFELGKEDPAYPGQQRFLVTSNEPSFPVGRWYVVRVMQRGDVISVIVNGRRLVRYADTRDPYRSGLVGLYTEDAAAEYQVIELQPAR
jgi:hypothetical protein